MTGQSPWQYRDFDEQKTGPLHGLKVLDLSRLVAGNMTSLQLADFGADVIKVEPLPAGDPLRAWKTEGHSTFWKVYARNKRSLALDFRADGAVPLLAKLIAEVDVLIEGFRPGTLEKMGLAPDDLLQSNPNLIILRVSGFGQRGSYSHRPGFGTLVEALSGFAQSNGEADGGPLLPPLALADMIAGLYGANAIMMALHVQRNNGGDNNKPTGQIIDLALLDSIVSILGPEALDFSIRQKPKPRLGNATHLTSPRNAYQTRDGHFIAISASIQNMAERLFRIIGRPDMIDDPRFATNEARCARHHEVDEIIGEWMIKRDCDELMAIFTEHNITAAPLYDSGDIADDPHFQDRGIYINTPDDDLGHIAMHAPVPDMSATPAVLRYPAPALGEHSLQILSEMGLSEQEMNTLIDRNIIKGNTS